MSYECAPKERKKGGREEEARIVGRERCHGVGDLPSLPHPQSRVADDDGFEINVIEVPKKAWESLVSPISSVGNKIGSWVLCEI